MLAVPFIERSRGRALPLLNADEAARVAAASELVRYRKGDTIYRARTPIDSVYNLVQGAAKTYQSLPGNVMHVTRFLFPGDVFGLAEQGQYAETAEAIIASAAYRIPMPVFAGLLGDSAEMAVRMLCRLSHDLRETQRQCLILARNDAVGRIAMFVEMLGRAELMRGPGGSSYLPMSRGDIAGFVGLTIEAVSRAFSMLERLKIIDFVDRHHFHILNREALQSLCEGAVVGEIGDKRGGGRSRDRTTQ